MYGLMYGLCMGSVWALHRLCHPRAPGLKLCACRAHTEPMVAEPTQSPCMSPCTHGNGIARSRALPGAVSPSHRPISALDVGTRATVARTLARPCPPARTAAAEPSNGSWTAAAAAVQGSAPRLARSAAASGNSGAPAPGREPGHGRRARIAPVREARPHTEASRAAGGARRAAHRSVRARALQPRRADLTLLAGFQRGKKAKARFGCEKPHEHMRDRRPTSHSLLRRPISLTDIITALVELIQKVSQPLPPRPLPPGGGGGGEKFNQGSMARERACSTRRRRRREI